MGSGGGAGIGSGSGGGANSATQNNNAAGFGGTGQKLGGFGGAAGFGSIGSNAPYGGAFNNSGIPERVGSTPSSDLNLVSQVSISNNMSRSILDNMNHR